MTTETQHPDYFAYGKAPGWEVTLCVRRYPPLARPPKVAAAKTAPARSSS